MKSGLEGKHYLPLSPDSLYPRVELQLYESKQAIRSFYIVTLYMISYVLSLVFRSEKTDRDITKPRFPCRQ